VSSNTYLNIAFKKEGCGFSHCARYWKPLHILWSTLLDRTSCSAVCI